MTAYERVLDALRHHDSTIRANGGRKASAQCPAHEDRAPSLSITGIEGRTLLHCHAGCDTADVLATLNLTLADLYDDPMPPRVAGIPAHASYAYDSGRRVIRSADKQFRQTGTEHRPELYRLAKVREAVATGRTVYVVEGEQDVHAVESLGGVATCCPMGAGKWSNVDPSPLYGGTVVVVADQDEPGRRHAADVRASLEGHATVSFVAALEGKDAADHIAAGHGLDDFEPLDAEDLRGYVSAGQITSERSVVLTKASSIAVRPVKWLWAGRLAEGTLALLGGREGIGKSTIAYTLAADYTRGRLPGTDHGKPRAVIVAATEDSWEHTINPRLMAAGADLDLVYRVDVTTPDGYTGDVLTLPRDIRALEEQTHDVDAGIILLDPLISRLDKKLDAHKDPEVRWALEPLVAIAERARVVVLGLIHVNKSASTDPLTLLMGSRAFAAVARAVLFVMKDPDNEEVRLLGQPKNNLGRTDLPTLTFRIESAHVADTEEGPVWTGRVVWQEDLDQSVSDVLASAADGTEVRTAVGEAADWLHDWLTTLGGTDASADIKTAARKAGHSESAVQRARRKLKLTSESEGHPTGRRTFWSLPGTQPGRVKPGESEMTDMTDINTGQSPQSPGVVSVVSVVSNISKPPARASDNEPDDHGPPQSAGGNPELGRIIQDLGGYCPGCGGFICECDPAP